MYHTQSNSFPMFFSVGNGYRGYDEGEMYSFGGSPSASVDCTLSLGTPSTRVTGEGGGGGGGHHQQEKKRSSCMSNFGWNILPSKHTPSSSAAKPHRGAGNGGAGSGGDPLLARRCANCDTTSTPLWRNGPRGPKSLCNACGIRYKKEERRATAAATSHGSNGGSGNEMMNGGWGQAQKSACYSSSGSGYGSEYRFMEDEAADHHHHRETEIPFMSWRFNVADRPGLVHDFTR